MAKSEPSPAEATPHHKVPLGVTLFNPAAFFNLLCDLLAPLRFAALLIWPLVIFATITALNNWYENQAHIERIFLTLSFFQYLLISMLTANLISKLMLGTAMAYFGAPPQQFGIRLLFGILPRFYVLKRPIRDLPFDQQRACHAAPLLTKLAMFALGMIMWAVLRRTGTGAADLCLTLSVAGLATFLFTVNPLWPADGYNWLAARLKRPHLRRQSMRLTAMVLRGRRPPEGLRSGEATALFLYAILSIVFSATIIFLVLQTIALALEEQLRGTGVAIFCVILAMFTIFMLSLRPSKTRAP
ncbi:MAG: hypothetical protein AB8B82_08125 [Roseovarius sp.]